MTSLAQPVRKAIVATCTTLFGPGSAGYDARDAVLICLGLPLSMQPDRIVAVWGPRVVITRPVMTPSRPREETVEVDVTFSVQRNGGAEDLQQRTTDAAYTLFDQFSDYYKTRGNETLGGVCREALVTAHELSEVPSLDPQSGNVTGRISEVRATVTAVGRI